MGSKKLISITIIIIVLFVIDFFLGTHTYGYTYVSGDVTITPTHRVATVQLGSTYTTHWAYYIPRNGHNYSIQGTLVTIGDKTYTFSHQIYFSTLPQNMTADGMIFTLQKHFIPVKNEYILLILLCLGLFSGILFIMLFTAILIVSIDSQNARFFIQVLAVVAIIGLAVGVYVNVSIKTPEQSLNISGTSYYVINNTTHTVNYKYVITYSNYTPALKPLNGYTIYSSNYQFYDTITYYVSKIHSG